MEEKQINEKDDLSSSNSLSLETRIVHGINEKTGSLICEPQEALVRKISVPTNTDESFKKLFMLSNDESNFTRFLNPTCSLLEQRLAHIEGGAAAAVVTSGMTAIQLLAMTLVCAGEEIVASSSLFAATDHMFKGLFNDLGIIVNFADVNKTHSFEAAVSPKTRFIYVETISNSQLDIPDIRKIADIAHKYKIPLVVDATYTPPVNYHPIDDGADIVIHSLSKWISGHGYTEGGVIIDSGKFDWRISNVPIMKVADPNNGGFRWAFDVPKEYLSIAMIVRLKACTMRTLGGYLAPDNAWMILQQMETLSLRMEKHNSNAQAVAKFLKMQPKVSWVRYPGLEDDPSHTLAKKQFGGKNGAIIVFAVEKPLTFMKNLSFCGQEKTIGTIRTAVLYFKGSNQIRMSVGIESIDDILADLARALNAE